MWALFVATPDRFVGDEPGIASTPSVIPRRLPPCDVRFVLILDPDCESVKLHASSFCQVEDVFLTIVQVARTVDGLEVSHPYIPVDVRVVSNILLKDGDGFDPVDHILESKVVLQPREYLKRDGRVGWLCTYVQKNGSLFR